MFSGCQRRPIYGFGHRLLLHFLRAITSLLFSALAESVGEAAFVLWHGHLCYRRHLCRLTHREPNEKSQRHARLEWGTQYQHGSGGGALRSDGFLRLPQIRREYQRLDNSQSPSRRHVCKSFLLLRCPSCYPALSRCFFSLLQSSPNLSFLILALHLFLLRFAILCFDGDFRTQCIEATCIRPMVLAHGIPHQSHSQHHNM